MYTDARYIDNQSIIEGDICIIGAGVAGISMAIEWEKSKYKVILLEGGGFEYDEKVQELYDGNVTGHPYYPMMSSRLHYFGGSSGHWGGMCSIFDGIDFKQRPWVPNSGWPITLADIEAYYPRAQPILDLGPFEYKLDYWQRKYPSYIPLPFDEKVIWNKMWQFSPPTRFGKKYRDTIVNSNNIHLYTYANVTDIKAIENISAISEISVKNYVNKQHTVKAKYFVLACSAIQNARLLLASNKQARTGLGNYYDLVGRYFMEHPEIESGELWLNVAKPLTLYRENSRAPKAELAISAKKQEDLEVLNGTVSLMPLEKAKNREPAVISWSEDDPRKSLDSFNTKTYSRAHSKNLLQRLLSSRLLSSNSFKAFGLYTRIEQSPNPLSRVTLNDKKDSLGVPEIDLNWKMTSIEKKTVRKINELIGQQAGQTGIGRVKLSGFLQDQKDETMPSYTSGGWHHMGTTRMSDNPKNGVVDKNCKVHGIRNLFIAGSSCYTTGGAVNPTLTIVAITLRLSDHIKEQMEYFTN